MSGFGGSMVWRHLDGTECCHRIARDSEAPDGCYCTVTHSDVLLDDGPPRPVFPQTPPPPSRYLNGPPPPRRRHRADAPGMYTSWPQALGRLGLPAVASVLLVAVLIGVVWGVVSLLS